MLALHLLQSALVHINTMLLQRILSEPAWSTRLSEADRRALTPLFWTHVNPYGKFTLDMDTQLDLDQPHQASQRPSLPLVTRTRALGPPGRRA
jgi:Tn3 transposase DDE domain